MTEPTPDPSPAGPEPSVMPRWVPVLIGAILVLMAGLAVFTGLRERDEDTILGKVRVRRPQVSARTPAPPGEPGAGASLVLHGDAGENTPAANAPVSGPSRAVITGGPGGVSAVVRIWARRGMIVQAAPADTMVYVNGIPIGQSSQLDTMDEAYEFAAPGSYTVRLVSPKGAEKSYVVTAAENAPNDVATIAAKF